MSHIFTMDPGSYPMLREKRRKNNADPSHVSAEKRQHIEHSPRRHSKKRARTSPKPPTARHAARLLTLLPPASHSNHG